MQNQMNRRNFLLGAEALVVAGMLNRAYAHVPPGDVASDEKFWAGIRNAYVRDPEILNLNNGGVAPAPTSVLEAEIEAIRYSNTLPAYRMWHDLEPKVEDVRKKLAALWSTDPECIAITRNASESLQIAQFGIDMAPGDEVLTTSQDYPRMITTWQQRAAAGKDRAEASEFWRAGEEPERFGEPVRTGDHAAHEGHSFVARGVHDRPDFSD